MDLLTTDQIDSIYSVTDGLLLHRNAVIVPLRGKDEGLEHVMPDGRVLIRGPSGDTFEDWFRGLEDRLKALELGRARAHR